MVTDLSLETRAGLPETLRVLLAEYPREAWESEPHFSGLVSMWLGMHQGFRRSMDVLRNDAESLLAGNLEPAIFARRLVQVGSQFVDHLHGHHHIEDQHYFPLLMAREKRLEHGFQILDSDHQALDKHIADFATSANVTLRAMAEGNLGDKAGVHHGQLLRFETFLDRHLTDEEDLIVPVILRHGVR